MKDTRVILVDESDNQTGTMPKMQAHEEGKLHRAVSVFIFNSSGQWLIQKRAENKYHSQGLWTNTCCTHPLPGESAAHSAGRRLEEEMGMKCNLKEIFTFIYREKLENGLTEYEYDHVFAGYSDDEPLADSEEVMDWKYADFGFLSRDISENPGSYTVWFREIYGRVNSIIKNSRG